LLPSASKKLTTWHAGVAAGGVTGDAATVGAGATGWTFVEAIEAGTSAAFEAPGGAAGISTAGVELALAGGNATS
jgi:hypothetical protein